MKNNAFSLLGAKFGLLCAGCLLGVCLSDAARAQDASAAPASRIVDQENRWIVVIDASPKLTDGAKEYRQALKDLRNDFVNVCGVSNDHVIFYSQYEKNPEFQATRENILGVVAALRVPNLAELKVPDENGGSKTVAIRQNRDKPAEFQLYLIARGVANPEETKFAILPADVDDAQIEKFEEIDAADERMIVLNEIYSATSAATEDGEAETTEAALARTSGGPAVERTLFVANFLSTVSSERNGLNASNLRDVDLKKVGESVRGTDELADQAERAAFFHGSVLVNNENLLAMKNRNDAFFRVLHDGLDGYADISGNRDGVVQASELLRYIQANDGGRGWQFPQAGNDQYPICQTEKTLVVPASLMKKLGDSLVEYEDVEPDGSRRIVDEHKAERESALKRYEILAAQQGVAETETTADESEAE